MTPRWQTPAWDRALCQALATQTGVSPLLARCLVNRGFDSPDQIERFLNPRLKNLADPFLVPGMDRAVARLLEARRAGQPLVIFGDYDVDGVTSSALLIQVMSKLGWKVDAYLPHRRDEGYGLSRDGVSHCLEKHPVKLILAADCGSSAAQEIQRLAQEGVEVIVLDHHQISDPEPAALALVNPRHRAKPGQTPPFSELCSAGLSFKLAHALVKRLRDENVPEALALDVREWLDIVAVGTIADMVPLTGENRILATAGLERLNTRPCPGLAALIEVAQCPRRLQSYEASFQLSPRLNAAGRLENAQDALRLLLAKDVASARPIALSLDAQNRQRQTIEREIARQIVESIRERFDPKTDFVIIEGGSQWHLGVVGIVASRVVGEFYRPSIVLGGGSSGEWRGSGRSIEGFDMAAALRQCSDLLLQHGGHAMAAGLALAPENVPALRQRLNELARAALKPKDLQPVLKLDGEAALSDLTVDFVDELERLNPTGQNNPPVRLALRGLTHQQPPKRIGKENQHLRLRPGDGNHFVDAIWWNHGAASLPESQFDLAVTPQIDEYNGRRSVRLKVLDLAGPADDNAD